MDILPYYWYVRKKKKIEKFLECFKSCEQDVLSETYLKKKNNISSVQSL